MKLNKKQKKTLKKTNIHSLYSDCKEVSTADMKSRYLKVIRKLTNKNPIKVPIRERGMTSTGTPLRCHPNVAVLVSRYGGEKITGYYVDVYEGEDQIALMPHSVWKTPEGKLVDVTKRTSKQDSTNPSPNKNICFFIPFISGSEFILPHVQVLSSRERTLVGVSVLGKNSEECIPAYEMGAKLFKSVPKVFKFVKQMHENDYFGGYPSLEESFEMSSPKWTDFIEMSS